MKVNGKTSAVFPVNTGVRQGAIASPILFNFIIDWVMRHAISTCIDNGKNVGISVGGHQITDLDYADDIALLADNETDLQFFVDQIIVFGKIASIRINLAPKIIIQGVDIKNFDSFHNLFQEKYKSTWL